VAKYVHSNGQRHHQYIETNRCATKYPTLGFDRENNENERHQACSRYPQPVNKDLKFQLSRFWTNFVTEQGEYARMCIFQRIQSDSVLSKYHGFNITSDP
jgi:hypothetical protein